MSDIVTAIPCVGCGVELDCRFTDPIDLYSLDGPVFHVVIFCPPGYDCNLATEVHIICCEQELVVQIPIDTTPTNRTALITALVNRCRIIQEFCGGPISPLYYNTPRNGRSNCPGAGQDSVGVYTYTVPAGTFAAATQEEAERLADLYVTQFVLQNHFCVAIPALCLCFNEVASRSFTISGGKSPFTPSITGGHVPSGITLTASAHQLLMGGTPQTPGNYQFALRVADSSGGLWSETITARVLAFGYASAIAEGFTVPAVASNTPSLTFALVTTLLVGATVRLTVVSGSGYITTELGTFTVFSVAGSTIVLTNVTATPTVVVAPGSVARWTIATLPSYTVGNPYSFQLPVDGGSGHYALVHPGSLPTGLIMSDGGLISGTPTDGIVTSVQVEIVDLACPTVFCVGITLTLAGAPVVMEGDPIADTPQTVNAPESGGYSGIFAGSSPSPSTSPQATVTNWSQTFTFAKFDPTSGNTLTSLVIHSVSNVNSRCFVQNWQGFAVQYSYGVIATAALVYSGGQVNTSATGARINASFGIFSGDPCTRVGWNGAGLFDFHDFQSDLGGDTQSTGSITLAGNPTVFNQFLGTGPGETTTLNATGAGTKFISQGAGTPVEEIDFESWLWSQLFGRQTGLPGMFASVSHASSVTYNSNLPTYIVEGQIYHDGTTDGIAGAEISFWTGFPPATEITDPVNLGAGYSTGMTRITTTSSGSYRFVFACQPGQETAFVSVTVGPITGATFVISTGGISLPSTNIPGGFDNIFNLDLGTRTNSNVNFGYSIP